MHNKEKDMHYKASWLGGETESNWYFIDAESTEEALNKTIEMLEEDKMPFERESLKVEPITAIDGIRLATAYAAKHCGEYAAASNLVSSYSSVEQQLLWIPDNAVIEVVETNGLVRIVDP